MTITLEPRLLGPQDLAAVTALLDQDPVANVFVASRLEQVGPDLGRLGAELWGLPDAHGRLGAFLYAGANLVPVGDDPAALAGFAGRALRQGRRASSLVGPAHAVGLLWDRLAPEWGPARDVRATQPLLATDRPGPIPPDPDVRRVQERDLPVYLPACVAMFTEEVGVSPVAGGMERHYRDRVLDLIRAGRCYARFDRRGVVFKAEIGAVSRQACQVQGVWVRPDRRARGIAAPGMAAVIAVALADHAPIVSLYVNDYNERARATYRRVGFAEVGRFATVLF
jgi:predicted GNAT family acetyltransferase